MEITLTTVCRSINNYFYQRDIITDFAGDPIGVGDVIYQKSKFTITDETITPINIPLLPGQYVRLVGSVLSDGIYLLDADLKLTGAKNEAFTGTLIALAIPQEFVELVGEISAFMEKSKADNSGLISESFSGYSYSKATTATGAPLTWKEAFAGRLNPWRKMYEERVEL